MIEEKSRFENFCKGKGSYSYKNLLSYAKYCDKFDDVMIRELNVNNIAIS